MPILPRAEEAHNLRRLAYANLLGAYRPDYLTLKPDYLIFV